MKEKLAKLTEMLLDTGKRNNLINFRDNKSNTLEVVYPDFNTLFHKADGNVVFEVFDPQIDVDEFDERISESKLKEKLKDKSQYIDNYTKKIKKASQILVYNKDVTPIKAMRSVEKRAKTAIEETGVNIAYMAFGFITWYEEQYPDVKYDAPILLAPISLSKSSSVEPYRIKVTGDDMILNPTFAYKLLSDYKIELPEYDDEGIDEYLQKIDVIVSKLKWQVSKVCKIGLFSFLKINMYMDLKDNADAVLQNANVRSLLGEGRTSAFEQKLQEAQFNVVDADSSQLRAIEMAKAGESFVLQGPPGTGKSQTITNIIAECMGDGKKVLFVSEKLAALDVVFNKLKQAGLEDFCLQLHSHKANKRDFIQELCRTMRLSKSGVSSKASEEEDRLNKSHIILDNYVDVLHRPNDVIGKSLYELIQEVCSDEGTARMNFFVDDIENKGESYIKSAVDLIENYAEYTSSIGYDYKSNPWLGYVNEDNSYQQKFKTQTSLESLSQKVAKCNIYSQKLSKEYGIENIKTLQELGLYAKLFELIGASQYVSGNLLDKRTLRGVIDKVIKLRPLADEIKTVEEAIKVDYNSGIFRLDATQANTVLQKSSSTFSRLFSKEYKNLLNKIKEDRKNGKASYKDALALIKLLIEYNDKTSQFAKLEESVKEKLSSNYCGVNTNWQTLDRELATLRDLLAKISDLGNLTQIFDSEDYAYDREQLASLAKEISDLTASVDSEAVIEHFDRAIFDIYSTEFEALEKKLNGCLASLDALDSWTRFLSVLKALNEKGLTAYIDVAVKEEVLPRDMARVFKKIFYSQWIDVIIQREEFLRVLPRVTHDKTVGIFCDKDMRGFEISKAKVRATLSALRPDLSLIAPGSAVANLLNEGGKKRRQKPIRTLMSQIRELAQNLKPCFLMSPLSVSTFLTPDVKFDVVVFDEASQIFPQDAIGAIYRAKQLIVVGDSKQMPPSNFFTSVVEVDDMEDDEDVKDFESVLDLCSTVMPQLRLKWHYRSRYEQLIEFSNRNFYEGDLVTFPSSKIDREGIGVDFKFVEGGVFDHKSRTNRAEADYIVDLVFENIEKYPDRSLGVVAFSISQQDLIERLLAKRRLQDSRYEEFFASDKVEPFFVKNLETVQGDERDTIIFSVAYGKDKDGKMSQNFGPINKMGGERRLNVAFTRAKLNVQLVASVHSYDINLKNSNSLGARLLRDYIEFAQNGSTDVAIDTADNEDCQSFDFEMQVAQFLRSKGYEVDVKIGASAGSVDIGVKALGGDDYVLAVECDGRSYKSAKNTRDRDRLRASILQRMGWHYHRVWAIDWIKNNKDEKDRLLKALEEALQTPSCDAVQDNNSVDVNLDDFEVEQISADFKFSNYSTADIQQAKRVSKGDYLKYLRLVLEKEAPLSEELFLKRTIRDFDRAKITDVVWERFNRFTSRCQSEGIVRKNGFMYIKNRPVELRLPNADFVREVKYIALEELADGMYKVICKNITVDRMGLYRMLAKLLGFNKLGEAMIRRFDEALALLKGRIDIEGEELSIKG